MLVAIEPKCQRKDDGRRGRENESSENDDDDDDDDDDAHPRKVYTWTLGQRSSTSTGSIVGDIGSRWLPVSLNRKETHKQHTHGIS